MKKMLSKIRKSGVFAAITKKIRKSKVVTTITSTITTVIAAITTKFAKNKVFATFTKSIAGFKKALHPLKKPGTVPGTVPVPKNPKKIGIIAGTALVITLIGYTLVRAASLSVTETYDNPEKITDFTNTTICGGQIKLAEATWSTLTECNCNSMDGWYWYTTNGRSACWSKTLADSVSWNKGVGDDTDNPGTFTCATDVTALKDRMEAAVAKEWYKIVSDVNGTSITSDHNGQSGAGVISALAIADCVDGTRDLCTGDGCLAVHEYETGVTAVNISLRDWADDIGGKSALPYCADSGCDSSANSDFYSACEQNSTNDYPLRCYDGLFYKNVKTCSDGDSNYIWVAAASYTLDARILGYGSCSYVSGSGTSNSSHYYGFRVVVRP